MGQRGGLSNISWIGSAGHRLLRRKWQKPEDAECFRVDSRICMAAFLRQHLRLGLGWSILVSQSDPFRRNFIFCILGLDCSLWIYQFKRLM